jgi:AcrR family transcriptional regulator
MNTRERITRCAFAELERKGFEQFSLRAVSEEAGVTPMAIYRHFRNKEDLLRAIGEEAFEAWQSRVERIRDAGLDAWFRKVTRAYVEFALDEPARFDACFVMKTQVERVYPQDFAAGKSPAIALCVERIEAAQRDGEIEPGDALEMAMFIWAQLHGLVMLHRAGRFSLKRSEFLALCKRSSARALISLRCSPT